MKFVRQKEKVIKMLCTLWDIKNQIKFKFTWNDFLYSRIRKKSNKQERKEKKIKLYSIKLYY